MRAGRTPTVHTALLAYRQNRYTEHILAVLSFEDEIDSCISDNHVFTLSLADSRRGRGDVRIQMLSIQPPQCDGVGLGMGNRIGGGGEDLNTTIYFQWNIGV